MQNNPTENESEQKEDENPLDDENNFLEYVSENCKSAISIKYPDGSEGELKGNIIVIL